MTFPECLHFPDLTRESAQIYGLAGECAVLSMEVRGVRSWKGRCCVAGGELCQRLYLKMIELDLMGAGFRRPSQGKFSAREIKF